MEYLKVWTSFRELLEPLTDAERGRLFVAMLEYAESGIEPGLSGSERYVWPAARQNIKRASEENERMRSMGLKGGRPKNLQKPAETCENLQKPAETYENPYKDKDKDNINNTTTARAREDTSVGPVTLDPLILKVQQELNGLTDTHYAALNDYREQLGDDVVSYAVDLAVGNGVRNWSYVEIVLRGWVKAGVKTLGEAKAENERHRSQPKQPQAAPKLLRSQDYHQRTYEGSKLEQIIGVDDIYKEGSA